MKLLLDSHALLWSASEPGRLNAEGREAIEDGDNEVAVSLVAAWEIAIKQSIGKLELPKPAETWLPEALERTGIEFLKSALRVRALPWHHRDPFDRLLIAHAIEQGFTLVTRDDFAAYGVPILAA